MKNENVIKMARLMVGCKDRTCEDCLSQSKKLFGDNKCALIEYAEALDKGGYRKQSDTVKEFADCVNEPTTAEMLLWLAENKSNESIDIWHTATVGIIYVFRNGNAIKFEGKTLTEAIKQAYDWAKQEEQNAKN